MDYKIKKPVRLIELFAGIGAQAMALRDLGVDFEHYKVVEYDSNPLKSYNAIHNTNFETQDIQKLDGKDLEIVDLDKYCYIMTYSFPCTSLSTAGKQQGMKKGSNTSSSLLWEVERLLNEIENKPQILIMENVRQVLSPKNQEDFQAWKDYLTSLGYNNFVQLMCGSDYGVPQNRTRCFMVSIYGDYTYTFPKKIDLSINLTDLLEDNVDEKYYFDRDFDKGGRFYQQVFETYDNNKCTYGTQIDAFNKRTNDSKIFSTITTRPDSCKTGIIIVMKDGRIRKISALESWRAMGFTDEDFYKAAKVMNNKTSLLYKQAGNSIIKPVLMALFKQLF